MSSVKSRSAQRKRVGPDSAPSRGAGARRARTPTTGSGEQQFGVAIESLREPALLLNVEGQVVSLNAAAERLAQCAASEAVGAPAAKVFADWPELVSCLSANHEFAEHLIARGSESRRYFAAQSITLVASNDISTQHGQLIVLREVSERVRAEQAMKESEERFRSIFAEVPIGIAVIDLEGHLLQVNKAFSEMVGYDELQLIGINILELTHPDDIGADGLLAGKSLSGEIATYKVEKRFLKHNGETLWADLTSTILRDESGSALYGLVMLENVIERKRAKLLEEERYHVAYELHDGLAQVTVSVHQHLQALASHYHPRSLQAKQELAKALELAQHSVREARRLISGLRPTILDDFGLVMALRLQIEALRKDGWTIQFEEALGQERLPPKIETTLFGVAQEALTNVGKHSHTKHVSISLKLMDDTIRVMVQDWGCGFEPRTLFKVYRPGEHLGIRAMQERVELVGGHLHVTSQAGVGTLVVAEVPLQPHRGMRHDEADDPVTSASSSYLLRNHLAERTEQHGFELTGPSEKGSSTAGDR